MPCSSTTRKRAPSRTRWSASGCRSAAGSRRKPARTRTTCVSWTSRQSGWYRWWFRARRLPLRPPLPRRHREPTRRRLPPLRRLLPNRRLLRHGAAEDGEPDSSGWTGRVAPAFGRPDSSYVPSASAGLRQRTPADEGATAGCCCALRRLRWDRRHRGTPVSGNSKMVSTYACGRRNTLPTRTTIMLCAIDVVTSLSSDPAVTHPLRRVSLRWTPGQRFPRGLLVALALTMATAAPAVVAAQSASAGQPQVAFVQVDKAKRLQYLAAATIWTDPGDLTPAALLAGPPLNGWIRRRSGPEGQPRFPARLPWPARRWAAPPRSSRAPRARARRSG